VDHEGDGLTQVTPVLDLIPPITPSSNSSSSFSAPNSLEKRKRKRVSAKERVNELMEELSLFKDKAQKLESENFYLKYNILISQQITPVPNPHLATIVQNLQLPPSFPDYTNHTNNNNIINNNNNNNINNTITFDNRDADEKERKKLKANDFVGVRGGEAFWVARIIKKLDDTILFVQWYEEHPRFQDCYYESVGQDEIDYNDVFCSGFIMQKGEEVDLSRKEYEDGEETNKKRRKTSTGRKHPSDVVTKVQLYKPSIELSSIYVPKDKEEDEEMRDENIGNEKQ